MPAIFGIRGCFLDQQSNDHGLARENRDLDSRARETISGRTYQSDSMHDGQPDNNPETEAKQLAGTVRDLSYMLHGLGHDLREPIRMITAYTALLKARTSMNDDTDCREYLHFIGSAAQRLQLLVAGILDYARLLEGNTEPHVLVDMNTVLQTALANLQIPIEEAQATIVHDELPAVSGRFTELTQLMQNLISNSIKYRGSARPQILVKADRDDSGWLFSVEDNGIGIEPQYREGLFLPFKRLHGQDIPGVGLGLSICRFIVERHGGRIWINSERGRGTTVSFTLPRIMESA
jgi:light-regulated signal transduction histidine kinase (bacteriophytochrome)